VGEAQPGGRDPAPGTLALVQAFVNTNDIEGRRDEFASPEAMRAWLVERGLLDPDEPVSADDFVGALVVREALRALAAANNGLPLPPEAVETLDRTTARTLAVQFTPGGGDLNAVRPGVDGVLGRLLAIVLEAMREGSWSRVKACHRDVCRWVFYDHSRNRSSTWCAMSICGNRVKTRSYRRRRAEPSASR
jgi:predicted RNA-binding Zn ribbon-like protein